MFHIGQQVVCLSDSWRASTVPPELTRPRKGGVYTILGFADHPTNPAIVGLHLCELDPRPAWASCNFRPVKPTSIEVFERLLAPTPERVA